MHSSRNAGRMCPQTYTVNGQQFMANTTLLRCRTAYKRSNQTLLENLDHKEQQQKLSCFFLPHNPLSFLRRDGLFKLDRDVLCIMLGVPKMLQSSHTGVEKPFDFWVYHLCLYCISAPILLCWEFVMRDAS